MFSANGHPNATRAGLVVVLVDILDRINNHYSWLHLSNSDTLLVGGAIVTSVLYVGKRGLIPSLRELLMGGLFGSQPTPPVPPTPGAPQ